MERKAAGKQRINSLEGLRTIAFLGIFLSHSGVIEFNVGGPWGVSAFFILSGFLMTYNHYDDYDDCNEEPVSIKKMTLFSWRKIIKPYPLHILMLVISIPFGIKGSNGSILCLTIKFFMDVCCIQSWIPNSNFYYSFNAVSWYLSAILFLYFMFPLINKIMHKYEGTKTAWLVIVITFGVQILLGWVSSKLPVDTIGSDGFTKWFVYIFPLVRLEEFIVGCNVSYLVNRRKRHENRRKRNNLLVTCVLTIMICVFACFICLFPETDELLHSEKWWLYTCVFTPVNASIVVLLAYGNNFLSSLLSRKWMIWIGSISGYAFLIHQLVLRYFGYVIKFIPLNEIWRMIIKIVVSLVITVLISFFWTRLIKSKVKKNA